MVQHFNAQNLESARIYGLHIAEAVYSVPHHINRLPQVADGPPANHDLTFTIDMAHVPNPQNIITTALGYDDVTVYLSATTRIDMNYFSSVQDRIYVLHFEEEDLNNTGIGAYQARRGPRIFTQVHAEQSGGRSRSAPIQATNAQLQERADQVKTSFDAVQLIEAHFALGLNYLVSDDPTMPPGGFGQRTAHWTTSTNMTAALERLERRRGKYYVRPNFTYSRGIYYRRQILQRVPQFDRTWTAALYGVDAKVLPEAFQQFTQSLEYRLQILLQLRDELELLAEEKPDNEIEWEMVNKLNYFTILVTGLLDNLAWLAALRHGLIAPGNENQIVLKLRQQETDPPTKNSFHKQLAAADAGLYDYIKNLQPLLGIFYPIRDSIQHRLIITGCRLENLDDGYVRVVAYLDDKAINALRTQEVTTPFRVNSWGVFEDPAHQYRLEPSQFSHKVMDRVLELTDDILRMIDLPALLAQRPDLLAIVGQQPQDLIDFIEAR